MEINNKLYRLVKGVFFNNIKKREGKCTPTICETMDGRIGSACCKLGYTCPFLLQHNCSIYQIRPTNCCVFPSTESDLLLVKNCGYFFKK